MKYFFLLSALLLALGGVGLFCQGCTPVRPSMAGNRRQRRAYFEAERQHTRERRSAHPPRIYWN